jgi:hypothetical protein
MTWYDTRFSHAMWQEFARLYPEDAQAYRQHPGLCSYLRPVLTDFFMMYEGR